MTLQQQIQKQRETLLNAIQSNLILTEQIKDDVAQLMLLLSSYELTLSEVEQNTGAFVFKSQDDMASFLLSLNEQVADTEQITGQLVRAIELCPRAA